MYFLYKITSPSGYFYVGVTKNPELRFGQHARSHHPIGNAIRKYGKGNMRYELIAFGTSEEIYAIEAYIVTEDFLKTQPTYNQKVGGIVSPAFTGKNHSETTKTKISQKLIGRVFSDEHRYKIGEKNRQRIIEPYSKERKEQSYSYLRKWRESASTEELRAAHKRSPHSEETKQKISNAHNKGANHHNARAILQYDLFGNFINEYGSIKIASNILGISESKISKIIRGLVKKPLFVFKYKENDGT